MSPSAVDGRVCSWCDERAVVVIAMHAEVAGAVEPLTVRDVPACIDHIDSALAPLRFVADVLRSLGGAS